MAQELKAYNVVATVDVNPEVVDSLGCTEFAAYDADEVDAVLAEKDKEIKELKDKLNETADKVYVVIEFERETDEFSEVEGVFTSNEEAEDFAKECSARYMRYSYGCYEGTIVR